MTLELVLKAVLLGIVNAAPIGPVGLMCLRANSLKDRGHGLMAALGMAVAYAIISFCVLFGLKAVTTLLENHRLLLHCLGGAVLLVMGWSGLRKKKAVKETTPSAKRYLADFSSSFAMTLFNPVPFATFAVLLSVLKVFSSGWSLVADLQFALLVAAGTMTFWLIVNEGLHHVKKHSATDWCRYLSKGAALAMVVLGVFLLGRVALVSSLSLDPSLLSTSEATGAPVFTWPSFSSVRESP